MKIIGMMICGVFNQVGRLLSQGKYEFYSEMKQIGVHLAVHYV